MNVNVLTNRCVPVFFANYTKPQANRYEPTANVRSYQTSNKFICKTPAYSFIKNHNASKYTKRIMSIKLFEKGKELCDTPVIGLKTSEVL